MNNDVITNLNTHSNGAFPSSKSSNFLPYSNQCRILQPLKIPRPIIPGHILTSLCRPSDTHRQVPSLASNISRLPVGCSLTTFHFLIEVFAWNGSQGLAHAVKALYPSWAAPHPLHMLYPWTRTSPIPCTRCISALPLSCTPSLAHAVPLSTYNPHPSLPSQWHSSACSCEIQTGGSGRKRSPGSSAELLLSRTGKRWCWWQFSSFSPWLDWSWRLRQPS